MRSMEPRIDSTASLSTHSALDSLGPIAVGTCQGQGIVADVQTVGIQGVVFTIQAQFDAGVSRLLVCGMFDVAALFRPFERLAPEPGFGGDDRISRRFVCISRVHFRLLSSWLTKQR